MIGRASRRAFLQSTAAAGALFSGGPLGLLTGLPAVSAQEAAGKNPLVSFTPEIEPLVRLVEETPRDQLLEQVAQRIQRGVSYQQVLAALQLAGIRNVQPRPGVGFKFHAVLVVNACHLASLAGPDQERWLPIFWALDHFKSSQADEARTSGWRMPPVNESLVPTAQHARRLFQDAMDRWDLAQADLAIAGLVRTAGATEIFNLLASYAARDFRAIGHKAIFLANAWRTLQVIGWEHAEPILRSLISAMLNHESDPLPAGADLEADRPWKEHAQLLADLPADWNTGKVEQAASRDLLATIRDANAGSAAKAAAGLLRSGYAAQNVWDAVFIGAGELLMQQPGITALHSVTSANALYFLSRNVSDVPLQQRLLLQACSFNSLFRKAASGRGQLGKTRIEDLSAAPGSAAPQPLESVLVDLPGNKPRAVQKLKDYLVTGGNPQEFLQAARHLIFLKARDAHDYKFSVAMMEDLHHVSPAWRNDFLAMSAVNLKGPGERDNALVARIQAAWK